MAEILRDENGKPIPQFQGEDGNFKALKGDSAPYSQIVDSAGSALFTPENPATVHAVRKKVRIIGDIVEPYEEGYKGVVGIFGHACFWYSEVYADEVGAIRRKGDAVYVSVRSGKLFKYDLEGNKLWEYTLSSSEIVDIAFDKAGNIYIGDWSGNVAKLSADGSEINRVNAIFEIGGNVMMIYAITDESDDGHLYLCGGSYSPAGGGIMKIDTNLGVVTSGSSALILTAKYMGDRLILGQGNAVIRAVSLSSFVQHWSASATGAVEKLVHDERTGKLFAVTRERVYEVTPSSGALSTVKTLNTTEVEGQGRSLAVDFEGNFYVGTDADKVYKLNAQGDVQWTFNSNAGRVLALDADDDEQVYVGAGDVKVLSTSIQFKGYKIVGGA